MQNNGTCCLKMFKYEKIKWNFVREIYRNSIVNENALISEGALMHFQGRPSDYFVPSFSHIVR